MLAFIIFVVLAYFLAAGVATYYIIRYNRLASKVDHMSEALRYAQVWAQGCENVAGDFFRYLKGANKRYKTFKRLWLRERKAGVQFATGAGRYVVDLSVKVEDLEKWNKQLSDNHASLVEDVMTRMLKLQDGVVVTQGLMRKLKENT